MPNVVEHRKFVFASGELNSNKVWEIVLFDNDDVEARWGRIGDTLQKKLHPGAGRDKMESLIRSKTKPSSHYNGSCYREVKTLDTEGTNVAASPRKAATVELKEIAKKQIATCAVTQRLVEFFSEVNAHDIYQATGGKITFDVSAGTFRTPIGIVTKDNVDSARALLDKLTDFIQEGDFGRSFVQSVEDYLMLIPQTVGRKFDPRAFCGDVAAIQHQSQILDGLDASIQSVLSASTKQPKKASKKEPTAEPKLFNVKMEVETDDKAIDRIVAFFNKGRKGAHISSRMQLKQAYRVDLVSMREDFEQVGAKMSNIQELWHGTSAANILSILKSGFVIPPATASHVCGRMFGHGVYFANSSTKSLNYSTGFWGGRDSGRYFMFLCQVALGNYYVPTGSCSTRPPATYDSYWAKAGRSGVINDELIVFRTAQINPLFLTEWGN